VTNFSDHVWTETVTALSAVPDRDRSDTYVVSFFVYDEEDDPRRPVLTVGTNTESQVGRARRDTDEEEARWNYAFWLQNQLASIGDASTDPIGAALRTDWLRSLGLWFDDNDESDAAYATASRITEAFVELCIQAVQGLHREHLIIDTFGRQLPVLIHELEYYDKIVEQNLLANPHELVEGLANWVGST
jgi:hypothetical protein